MLSAGYWFWLCFAHWVTHWVCCVQQDESNGKIRGEVVRPIPFLSPGTKPVPSLHINSTVLASSFTPELVGMCQFASPLFLLWIIFNFPSHLGWDKSTSLCGMRLQLVHFLLLFSLTCRPVYCSCLSQITVLVILCVLAVVRAHMQHRAVIISSIFFN